jgi:phage terminase small subunit
MTYFISFRKVAIWQSFFYGERKGEIMAQISDQYRVFIDEYTTHWSIKKAAIKAGYNPKWADTTGYAILQRPEVRAEVEKIIAQREEVNQVHRSMIIDQLTRIATADVKDFMTWNDDGTAFLDPSKVDGEIIAELNIDKSSFTSMDGEQTEKTKKKLKLHDKLKALELLGRHVGFFNDSVNLHMKANVTIVDDIGAPSDGEIK